MLNHRLPSSAARETSKGNQTTVGDVLFDGDVLSSRSGAAEVDTELPFVAKTHLYATSGETAALRAFGDTPR